MIEERTYYEKPERAMWYLNILKNFLCQGGSLGNDLSRGYDLDHKYLDTVRV